MNPLIYVIVTLHFEIKDSETFGGEGSVIYTMVTLNGVKNVEKMDDSFVDSQIKITANLLQIQPENMRLISKEEYDSETKDEKMEINLDGEFYGG